jgi:cytochrome P450
MQAWESTVRAVADDCIDTLLRDNPDGTADLVAGFAVPFPALVMAEVLGLPPGTRDLFLHGARRAVTGGSGENRSHALATLTGFLKENPASARDLLLYAARKVVTRNNSGDDRAESLALIARFLKETMSGLDEADGFLGRLAARSETDADEAAGIAAQVLIAGTMVPASMLGLALHLLLERPSGLAPFLSSPEDAMLATEEVFRFLSFESQPRIRVATEDVEIGGARVLAGQLVAVVLDTANRDPRVFPDPDVLRLDRDDSKSLAFGWGGHQCLGQNLARLEIRVALAQIARRLPGLRLDDSHGVVVRDDTIVHSVSSLPTRWTEARENE